MIKNPAPNAASTPLGGGASVAASEFVQQPAPRAARSLKKSGKAHRNRSKDDEKPKEQSNDDKEPKDSNRANDGIRSTRPEREATLLFIALSRRIISKGGRYLRDDDGTYQVVIGGKRIALNYDVNNYDLNGLLLDAVGITIHSLVAKSTIARLINQAHKTASKFSTRRFSGMSEDGSRLYIPIADNTRLLKVTSEAISEAPNGENEDSIWCEHPKDMPLKYTAVADPKAALADFKRLLVDTQSTRLPEMSWFVAMHEGLFPFTRDLFPARLIVSHIGGSQQGKTSAAQRFSLLHGLGDVKADYSVATLRNMPDAGLLILDNKEQANMTQEMGDYLLFLATGGEHGRSSSDGKIRTGGRSRPVGVITSIEGLYKKEAQNRNVEVEYEVKGAALPRASIENDIRQRRHEILSAMVPVLQKYIQIRNNHPPTPNPIPAFEEHFSALCNLLRAFGEVAGMPPGWSDEIISAWNRAIAGREPDEDELEHPIWQVLRAENALPSDILESNPASVMQDIQLYAGVTHSGKHGKLYVSETGILLTKLRQLNLREQKLAKNAQGLGRRLRDAKFQKFTYLTEENAPELPQLKRTSDRRPIGFFVQGE